LSNNVTTNNSRVNDLSNNLTNNISRVSDLSNNLTINISRVIDLSQNYLVLLNEILDLSIKLYNFNGSEVFSTINFYDEPSLSNNIIINNINTSTDIVINTEGISFS
jgi:hypothetical protein